MSKRRGRKTGWLDDQWPDRMIKLLEAITSIQAERHTVSIRELREACGVSHQSIANWLNVAEALGYVNRHDGLPRALQILPLGQMILLEAQGGRKRTRKAMVTV